MKPIYERVENAGGAGVARGEGARPFDIRPTSDAQAGIYPPVIHSHSTTWHDGNVAILLPDGRIYSLASERVGPRKKHYWDSRVAYDYLKSRFSEYENCFGSPTDFFTTPDEENFRTARHHLYHAASAFYGSPFEEAAIIVHDGQGHEKGELVSTTLWSGDRDGIRLVEVPFHSSGTFIPQSLGHFYTAVSILSGMQHFHEEGKTMGLAAHGRPSRFLDCFRKYAFSRSDGSFEIDPDFICAVIGKVFGTDHIGGHAITPSIESVWKDLMSVRGTELRRAGEKVTREDMDTAYAGQLIVEEIILGYARRAKEKTKKTKLCLAGGVALNCSANGKILASALFDDIYVFPASDDSGQAIGKLFHYLHKNHIPASTRVSKAYLGPEYYEEEVEEEVKREKRVRVVTSDPDRTIQKAASLIAEGKVLGWFQGRSEIGPRALGHRSILADPRRGEMLHYLNSQVKHREWYRPVAPAVLAEAAPDYFTTDRPSPFMLFACQVRPEKVQLIPAVTHVDKSARIQTVARQDEERFYRLIEVFASITGIPLVVNTSFNDKDEPMVESPRDALNSFLRMKLDALVIDRCLVVK
jgi:carbamoyltransferase